MHRHTLIAAFAALALAGCATSHDEMRHTGPLSFAAIPGLPASPQAKLYADCIAQSTAAETYDREGGLIRFRCNGAPAQAFYDGLAAWSESTATQAIADGRIWRTTQKMMRDLSGLDHCSRASSGEPDYACVAVFNAGDFIKP